MNEAQCKYIYDKPRIYEKMDYTMELQAFDQDLDKYDIVQNGFISLYHIASLMGYYHFILQ